MAAEQATGLQDKIANFAERFGEWRKVQPAGVDATVAGLSGAAQGALIGVFISYMGMQQLEAMKNQPGMTPPPQTPGMSGPAPVVARNFAVLSGMNYGVSHYLKRQNEGKEDWVSTGGGGFAGGFSFSLVAAINGPKVTPQGLPVTAGTLVMDALRTGLLFGGFQVGIMQVGKWFSGDPQEDEEYYSVRGMLHALNLEKFEKNFKKGQLNDSTLPLLNERVLKEVNIPPGPRLLITDYISRSRQAGSTQKQQANPAIAPLSLALPVEL